MTQKPFHILHLRKSEGFYGAERVILQLAHFFQNESFRSWIGVLNDIREPCLTLFEQANEKNIPAKVFLCRSRLDLLCILEIIKIIRTLRIDLIHTHGFKADVYGWICARCTGIPVISTQHGWTHKNKLIQLWEYITFYFLRNMNKIIGVAQEILTVLEHHKISPSKLEWIPNGVTIPRVLHSSRPFKKEYGIDPNTWTIGIIGRLSVEKGHRFFLEAMKEVSMQFPKIHAFIIGEGPLKEELISLVHAIHLNSMVHFLGFQPNMERWYSMLDIVVSSSLREGLPLTLLEAMAYGKPVVATRVGGVSRLIQNGVNGLLVDPEDGKALAKAIEFLIMHPSRAKQMGRSARHFVQKNYSVEKMLKGYQQIYEEFLSKNL